MNLLQTGRLHKCHFKHQFKKAPKLGVLFTTSTIIHIQIWPHKILKMCRNWNSDRKQTLLHSTDRHSHTNTLKHKHRLTHRCVRSDLPLLTVSLLYANLITALLTKFSPLRTRSMCLYSCLCMCLSLTCCWRALCMFRLLSPLTWGCPACR